MNTTWHGKNHSTASLPPGFAQNRRQVRRLKEISQEELLFRANVSKTYINEVERGSRAVSIDVMMRIADALEMPLEKLLQRDLTLME